MGRHHAENLRRLVPEARLVAIADVAHDRARQTAEELEIERYFSSIEEMLACKEIDALLIAVPDKFHARVIEAAAAAGKDMLCEKPLAINRADAQQALKAVAKAGVRLQVGFMRRYDPAYAAAMKRIEAIIRPGKLDEVKEALADIGVLGMTITEVKGFGRTGGRKEVYRGSAYVIDFVPKVKIEIVAADALVAPILDAIERAAKTAKIGDGKIFVYDVPHAVRIRTGESGEHAI